MQKEELPEYYLWTQKITNHFEVATKTPYEDSSWIVINRFFTALSGDAINRQLYKTLTQTHLEHRWMWGQIHVLCHRIVGVKGCFC
jgi:hypothetical protein